MVKSPNLNKLTKSYRTEPPTAPEYQPRERIKRDEGLGRHPLPNKYFAWNRQSSQSKVRPTARNRFSSIAKGTHVRICAHLRWFPQVQGVGHGTRVCSKCWRRERCCLDVSFAHNSTRSWWWWVARVSIKEEVEGRRGANKGKEHTMCMP